MKTKNRPPILCRRCSSVTVERGGRHEPGSRFVYLVCLDCGAEQESKIREDKL